MFRRISLAYRHYVKPEQLNDSLVTEKTSYVKTSVNIGYNRKLLTI